MGLEMSPGSVISQLNAMNESLGQIIGNGEGALSAVYGLGNTTSELKGESYDKIRDYYNTLHTAAIRGIILFAEAYIEENNAYKSCISGHLSGIGYVNEDALKEDKERIEAQIRNLSELKSVSVGFRSSLIANLENTLNLIRKKLKKIEAFVSSTQGLYQSVDSYRGNIRKAIGYLNQSSLNGIEIQYYCDDITRVWMSEITKSWIEKALEINEQYREPFVKNMQVQFGFDRETAEIFYKLYGLMDITGMENINQEYFAMIASVCYPYNENIFKDPKNYLWHFLAGTDTVEDVENRMKMYGLGDYEAETLIGAIEANHQYSQFLKESKLQETIPDNLLEYLEKADIGHMSVTLSTILKSDESLYEKAGSLSGAFNGIYDLNANAGYVGDIYGTAGNGPKLTPDDYKADLDSVNLGERMKNGGNAIIIMNQYYTGIADGKVNRAEEFATNLGNGSFEDGVQYLKEQQEKNEVHNNVLQRAQDAGGGVITASGWEKLALRDEWMGEKSKIPRNFIRCIQEKQNEYIAYEEVDNHFAETGVKQ